MSREHGEHKENGLDPLDRLLTGLGTAKVDAAFAQRTALGVKSRLGTRSTKRPMLSWGFSFASAAVTLAVVATVLVHRPHTIQPAPQRTLALAAPPPLTKPAATAPTALSRPRPRGTIARVPDAPATQVEPDAATQASFPAPPIPLSDQERLLLDLVHRNDPVEMAMLIPEVRERVDARERAEEEKFFYRPPIVDEKGNLLDANGKPFTAAPKGDKQ